MDNIWAHPPYTEFHSDELNSEKGLLAFKLFWFQVTAPYSQWLMRRKGIEWLDQQKSLGQQPLPVSLAVCGRQSPCTCPGEERSGRSPDWLSRLDVNWGWGRHIAGKEINPHVKGSLGTQDQAEWFH